MMLAELLPAAAAISVLLGLAWFLRRASPAGGPRRLHVVETAALAPGRTIAVVRAGGRCFLVAATQQSVTRLAELDAGEWRPVEKPAPGVSVRDFLPHFKAGGPV